MNSKPNFSPAKNIIINLSILLTTLIICLTIIEFFFRVIEFPKPIVSGWKYKGSEHKNLLGFRGQSINYAPEDFVILLVGDSQVEADACNFVNMPERRLEMQLNKLTGSKRKTKVFSIGAGGYGQDQQLLMMKEYFNKYRADLVLLWLTPKNDIWNNIFPTHWPKNGQAKPTFRMVNNKLYGPTEKFGAIIYPEKIKILAVLNRLLIKIGLIKQPVLISRDDIWEKYLPEPYKPMSNYSGFISSDWQKRWDNNIGDMKNENLSTEKSHLAICLTPRSKRMKYGLDLTSELLNEMKDLVNLNHGKFVVFYTQELQEKFDNEGDEVVHSLNGLFYKTSKKQYVDNLTYLLCEQISKPVLITIRDFQVSPENSHLNERADNLVMSSLAESIKSYVH
jgi:hypothetical protein